MTENEIKKIISQNYWNTLLQAIILRYQALTIISGLSAALIGVVATINFEIINKYFIIPAVLLSATTTIVSLGRYIFLIRKDIKELRNKIDELDSLKPSTNNKWDNEYWVEVLYVLFITSMVLSFLSFFIN